MSAEGTEYHQRARQIRPEDARPLYALAALHVLGPNFVHGLAGRAATFSKPLVLPAGPTMTNPPRWRGR